MTLLRPPGTAVPGGRMFYCGFFPFFSYGNQTPVWASILKAISHEGDRPHRSLWAKTPLNILE